MTRLSANVQTKGLAKNKLLVVLGVLGAILLSALMFGIFTTDKGKADPAEDNPQPFQLAGSNPDQLLQQVTSAKQMHAASSVVTMASLPESKSLQMVPPIIDGSLKTAAAAEGVAQTQHEKKELQRVWYLLAIPHNLMLVQHR
jgi:hypothetical protein